MQLRLLIVFLLCSLGLAAQQSHKGAVYFDGLTGLSSLGSTVAPLDPFEGGGQNFTVGYFISDRFLVGANPFEFDLFGRYYLPLNPTGRLRAFAELGVDFVSPFDGGDVNFQPALGLEYELRPGMLATVKFRQTITDRSSQNFTSLFFALNTYTRFGRDLNRKLDPLRAGAWLLNPTVGELQLRGENSGGFNYYNPTLHLGATYLPLDRLGIDVNFGYDYFDLGNGPTEFTAVSREVFASIGARYFLTPTGRFRPYVGAGVMFASEKNDFDYGVGGREPFRVDESYFSPYLKAGFLYQLDSHLAVDAGVDYVPNQIERINSGSDFRFGAGLKLTLPSKR